MRTLVALLLLGACSKTDPPPAPPVQVVTVTAAPPKIHTFTQANFFQQKELLDCLDYHVLEGQPDPRKPDKDSVLLDKTCDEMFPGRPAFASCMLESPPDAGPLVIAVDIVYDVHLLKDDREAVDCMKHGGKWKEMPKDDPRYQRAKLQAASHDLDELVRQYRQR